jgi:hypothetical protein
MNPPRRTRNTALALTACALLIFSQATAHAQDDSSTHDSRITQTSGSPHRKPRASAQSHMGLDTLAWREFHASERTPSGQGHMGLNTQAWREYRAGERVA